MEDSVITVEGLTKSFGSRTVLKNLHCSLEQGQILGFLGPNGAGKSTTMRILSTTLRPNEGRVCIDGLDLREDAEEIRKIVGYLPERPPLYDDLTVGQYIQYIGELRRVSNLKSRIGDVLDMVGLIGWESRRIEHLSKGFRQRVGLAQSIIHNPTVLILDEPSSGLDPSQVVGVRQLLKQISEDRTVIVSTHILSEVERLCTHCLILNNGSVIVNGTLDEVRNANGTERLRVSILDGMPSSAITSLGSHDWVHKIDIVERLEGKCSVMDVHFEREEQELLFKWLDDHNLSIRECYWHHPSLEEVFLSAVGIEQ